MSTTRPPVVTGFCICDETVRSCVVTQKNPLNGDEIAEPCFPCSSTYSRTVPTRSTANVASSADARRRRSVSCTCVAPAPTLAISIPRSRKRRTGCMPGLWRAARMHDEHDGGGEGERRERRLRWEQAKDQRRRAELEACPPPMRAAHRHQ